jgi:hypothetical protein
MPGRPNRRPRQPGTLTLEHRGHGRPPQLSPGKARKILADCHLTPMQVMAINMHFYHQEAELLDSDFYRLLEKGAPVKELQAIHRKSRQSRQDAQACAVDLAPYMHAKLSMVKIGGTRDPKEMADLELIENLASVSELLADEPEFAEAAE